MTRDELAAMPEDKLRALALEKNRLGNASRTALLAQWEIYRRRDGDVVATRAWRETQSLFERNRST